MIFNVHLPSGSQAFALPYRASDSLPVLLSRIADKAGIPSGQTIGKEREGWRLKYAWEGSEWSLDDADDFEILLSRFKSEVNLRLHAPSPSGVPPAANNTNGDPSTSATGFRRPSSENGGGGSIHGGGDKPSRVHRGDATSGAARRARGEELKHEKEFTEFHSTNGVRTVQGSIGPVENVRMLIKAGYRNVYISRNFAQANGFIPQDAAPGWYGYTGLVNLGSWPIRVGSKTAKHVVMLSEESHFDVILGRAWMEKMGVRMDALDPTTIILTRDGAHEQIPCELVIIRDGRGDVVTVT